MAGPAKAPSTAAISTIEPAQRLITRTQLFAAVFIVGWANFLLPLFWKSVGAYGWLTTLAVTSQISLIVWGALFCALSLLLTDDEETASKGDAGVSAIVLGLLLLPSPASGRVALLTVFSAYVILTSRRRSNLRKGATIMLAVTVPTCWSKLLFAFFAKPLLLADAMVVAFATDSSRRGNVIGFADGSGHFQVLPGCSSLHDVSLAFLAFVTLTQMVLRRPTRLDDLVWPVAACMAVVAINIGRLSLLSLFPKYYQEIHVGVGAAIAGTMSFTSIMGILVFGFRRELLARP